VIAALDPVGAHVAELDRVLHGPGAAKRSMIAEVSDGLHDAAAAYRDGGLDPQQAAATAVQDFGPVREIAPLMQEELVARQGRSTALLLVVAFPTMLVAWDLLWTHDMGWPGRPSDAVVVMARLLDGATVLIASLALILLLVTFRRSAPPRLCAKLAGLTGAAGALLCGGTSVVMNLGNAEQARDLVMTKPPVLAVAVTTVVVLGLVARSATRSLRIARTKPGSPVGT
jgi:hypothetical protein